MGHITKCLIIRFCLFVSYLLLSSDIFPPFSDIVSLCYFERPSFTLDQTNVPKNTSKPVALSNISKHDHSVRVGTPCPSPKRQNHSLSIVGEHVFDIFTVILYIWRPSLLSGMWGRTLLWLWGTYSTCDVTRGMCVKLPASSDFWIIVN